MKYKAQIISGCGQKREENLRTWRDAKRAMRRALKADAVRAIAYEREPKCSAYSHVGEWAWQEAGLLK